MLPSLKSKRIWKGARDGPRTYTGRRRPLQRSSELAKLTHTLTRRRQWLRNCGTLQK